MLLYLFRRIEESLDGRPTLIILDEHGSCWVIQNSGAKSATGLNPWREKLLCSYGNAQQLSDAANSGILDVVSQIMSFRERGSMPLYINMGLNRRQIEIIASAVPETRLLLRIEEGRRLYQLALGPLCAGICWATDPDSIDAVKQLSKHTVMAG